ncbi:MAG: DNA polymerase IV [Candidatus Omnitrophota bacterium]|nr:DNA polymerase IV [Candidatus Omnitrophota bacterium]
MKRRYITHVDMDAFFSSIEERDRPNLRGLPVVVGADPRGGKGRGVVSTCSYEARKYGIHSAMPISAAYRKCPKAVFLPVDMEKYSGVSARIREILYSFSPDVEPISIDEAFLDITGSYHLFGTPLETCRLIKARIKKLTGLTASLGLAPTKMAAKIASDIDKPDGIFEVTEDGLQDFLKPLEVRRLWGLGEKREEDMRRLGIRTIGDLALRNPEELIGAFGKVGLDFWKMANGIDERPVESALSAKSISNEVTFDIDTAEDQKVSGALLALCEKVSARMRRSGLKCRTVTLKIRLADFSTFTRSVTIGSATNFIDILYAAVIGLYKNFDKRLRDVRLLGVKAANLCPTEFKDSLFEDSLEVKLESRHKALDKIKEKFGENSIFIAGSGIR